MRNLLIVLVLILAGCKAQTVSVDREVRDSVAIRWVEKEVTVPRFEGESNPINLEEIRRLLAEGVSREVIEKTIMREDPETKLKVGILIDELGNLTAYCEKQEEVIKFLLQERDFYRTEIERIVERERENIFKEIGKYVRNTLIVVGVIMVIFVLIRIFR